MAKRKRGRPYAPDPAQKRTLYALQGGTAYPQPPAAPDWMSEAGKQKWADLMAKRRPLSPKEAEQRRNQLNRQRARET